ncbi:MAG: PilZ domain-containing protein [Sphingomonas oligoaromativorans]|jgi:hypothetical protein|uniref:PilZ domain-containing protein n=1 Tax=Sphingomonas oligoaromativorans TaxID=575322 RepID=UPI00142099BE|nr:PilZ domain-containing protein [Sphingomonas oligoaromativorans]NIJ33587.1 hypothetical protein [Sphingomonas oligoaromativorans]
MAASAFELPQDKRDNKRSRLLLTARMECHQGVVEVHLLNISHSGAKLDADEPPARDERVVLIHEDLRVEGRVAWVEDHRFGVAFDNPIDERHIITRGQQKLSG